MVNPKSGAQGLRTARHRAVNALRSCRLFSVVPLVFLLATSTTHAQVKLGSATYPSAGQPNVQLIRVTGSGFPVGTSSSSSVTVSFAPAVANAGPSAQTPALGISLVTGSMFTVTFQIPAALATQTPIAYLVSISGITSTNVPFSSVNSASLTINPAPKVTIAPTSGQQGQFLSVTISGQYTNFLQGATKANFGPGVSVGGATSGQPGPVTVTSPTSAVAQLQIDPSASTGANTAVVGTGVQQATTTFTIATGAPAVSVSSSLTFSSQQIGTTSATQPDIFTNTGTQPLSITNIAMSGANPAEFIQTSDCPIFPSTLAAGAHCTFQVSFAPLAVGTRTAAIVITDNAGNVPGSMQSISLSGTGVAPPPQTITIPLTFNPGTNVSQTATLFCPSGTTPCTDANAHSLKVTVTSVTAPFTLTVTAFEVSTTEANGICENGQTETTDFDCRFQTYFAFQTLPNGDIVTPLCIPYSRGNCVFYRVGNIPPTSSFQGPVWEYIAWNNTALVPPQNYQANNPRLYDDPDAPPYDQNHQFVFDITDYFNANANKVGVDPGIAGHTIQFNDFVVAWPPVLFNPNIAFAFLSPASGSSITQGTQLPVSFSLTLNATSVTNAVSAPNAVSMGVVDSNGVRMPTLAPNGSSAAFIYDPKLSAYTLTLATQSYPPGTYTLFVNSDLFPQQSTTFTITAGAAASITATGGGPQSIQVNTTFPLQLSVTVLDASGSPVS
jgi:hypothetical protein